MKRRIAVFACLVFLAAALPAFAGAEYAGADEYDLDTPHTQIMFSIDHLGFSRSYGKFLKYEGRFLLDRRHPEKSSVEVAISTDSVDMGDKLWNEKVAALFKPEQFPQMTFKSTAVRQTSKRGADVTGDLTLLGVTKPVTLHVTFNKAARNPFGKYVCGFSATADIKRSAFGMRDYLPLVGDDVHIMIEVEGQRRDKPGEGQYNR